MYFCKKITRLDKMFNRFNEVLQTAAEVLAPPPTSLQNFEYHWKQIKCFYTSYKTLPKMHLDGTNIPFHLEEMLQIIIQEVTNNTAVCSTECLDFVLNTRPLDLLSELAISDSPPGATVSILNWVRRFLSCLPNPHLDHEGIFQPVQKLIGMCNGCKCSPYEEEEILFLLTVSGLVRKEPFLINLFLPSHQHSAYVNSKIKGNRVQKIPTKNSLFEVTKVEPNIRRISIVHESDSNQDNENCDISCNSGTNNLQPSDNTKSETSENSKTEFSCDCDENDRLFLLDAIIAYFQSPDSIVVVRATEGALILASLPSVDTNCMAVKSSLNAFSINLSNRLATLCQQIPEDMDTGDIEDCNVAWGFVPRDVNAPHFVGRGQLNEFLGWLDYTNCISNECSAMSIYMCDHTRKYLLENVVEPAMLDINAQFMLVLAAKVVKQLDSKLFSEELANWLIGNTDEEDIRNDCLLTILIENAQENSDILLPTLQFIESLLDNTNERILNGMLFRYINNRGYFDASTQQVQTWSDEEDERHKRRGSADGPIKSRTLAPSNILKVINNFLLLLPRQIMCESFGTCYEEYVQDASRHYQNWITRTSNFNWPIEAIFQDKCDSSPETLSPSTSRAALKTLVVPKKELQCSDSGISEENFYEGPLLRLLFLHVRNMASHPYELNLAVIAILSKLAFLPHPYLHEILLNPEIPIMRGTNTLWSSMQHLARQLLLEVPCIDGFQKKVAETGKRLLTNPPMISETTSEENDPLFESLVVLEEFCKELAAIAFVKYHHATE